MSEGRKNVSDDDTDPMLDLIFTYTYDDVEINSEVPWIELSDETQRLAKKVVDHYRMRASVNVDAQVTIRALNIESDDNESGLMFSLIAAVDPLGDNEIDYQDLFSLSLSEDDDEDDDVDDDDDDYDDDE
jgi:hypothetical protein